MSDYNDGLLPEPCLRLDFGFGQQYASIELGDGSGYVRVAENAKLRELVQEALASHEKMCTQRGNCFGCQFFDTESLRACPIVTVNRLARKLGIEVG